MDSTRQYLRWAQVVVGTGGKGVTIDGSDKDGFRITFKVTKTVRHPPNIGNILLYNLHPDLEGNIIESFEDVFLNIGYQGAQRLVFRGNIRRAFGYWDAGDRVTEIQGADGDKDYQEAYVSASLAPGTTANDEIDAVIRAFASMGKTKEGHIGIPQKGRTRGKVLLGMARDILHRVADDNQSNWSIQDGFLHVVKSTDVLPDKAIVLNESTGLLEAPSISDKGIQVKSLLNPSIRINGSLLLDNKNMRIHEQQLTTNGPKTKPTSLVRQSPDGAYKVFQLAHSGDTRGPEWETISECVAVGAAIPSKGKRKPMVHL